MAKLPFEVLGVDHTGLAPKDPAKTHSFFSKILHLPHLGNEFIADQKTNTDIFGSSENVGHSGTTRLEILIDQGNGPVGKFLEKKGSGIHHIALRVSDVASALTYLKSQNVKLIDEIPRCGAHKTLIGFIHPESTGGLLIELVQSL